jgi:hypothetical protein
MLVNCSRTVLVDVDDGADRGEMFSPFPLSLEPNLYGLVETHSISSDFGREIFSPYSDCECSNCESEEEPSSEDELSSNE